MLQQLTRTAYSSPAALLQADAHLPSNCFRLSFDGALTTGFELELDHHLGGDVVFTGTRYMYRLPNIRGCLYEAGANVTFIRRAAIETSRNNNEPQLVRPYSADKTMLLQVKVGYPSNINPKIRFWTGVITEGCIVQHSREEILISLENDGRIDVFTEDGLVRRITREGDEFQVASLSLQDQGTMRIERALSVINSANRSDEQGAKRADAAYHEIVSILTIKSVRSTPIFQTVFDLLEQEAQAGKLLKGVRKHVLEALGGIGFEYEYFRDHYCGDLFGFGGTPMRFDNSTGGKGAPSGRKAKIAERAERDRQARSAMRGVSSGGKQTSSRKK